MDNSTERHASSPSIPTPATPQESTTTDEVATGIATASALEPADVRADDDRAWWVACHDPFGRDRSVTVLVDDGEVAVVPPPGAGAVLSARQTRRLRSTLDRAARTAGNRRP
ncbi:hypothetical protein [Actinoalloteichus hymeniacidonis]|uniref:hypothetical protein n=1 Tax=Actinoalloteichus hymeniacidonis TaxID=340345 RepID=UPI0012F8CE45|nr:hypothetical protein [Actinoalloteichus hymeniacidonis]MBB5906537.1 hypothetical protein [Actinoalloteichus hymeniacidonis]